MQKNMYILLFMGILISSCGNSKKDKAGDITDKKAQLEKLKTQQKDLNTQIVALETDLAKTDSGSVKVENTKLVSLTSIQPGTFSHYIDLEGKIDAVNISYVAPPNGQGGVVKELYVTQGQQVHKGQVLARLDDQILR
ncbi:MAG TPA: biotin/lipoyl-binding protein, partial [Flavisolibacter sp.]|nr:biotin/lipoyl-binding protein [Flavisolibacter sp.]